MKLKFWKFIVSFLLCTLYFVLYTSPAKAEAEFSVDANVIYRVQDNGQTSVTHDIILENNFSSLYATTYTLSLENIDTQNIKANEEVDGKNEEVKTEINKLGDKTDIKLTFNNVVVGKNAKRHFMVTYENGGFAVRTGEIWEISIPRLNDQDSFRNYNVRLIVPANLGLEAYISPRPKSSEENSEGHIYTFTKSNITQTGITAGFGQFQVFSFNLLYHLENPLNRNSETTIAIPPDTAFQKVYISKIEPKPDHIQIDTDGNWLAVYKLEPRQRIDVAVSGAVQIFAGFRSFPKPTNEILSDNLKETEYWQVNDPQIKALATNLKTPKAIYDYVSTTLKYDITRVQPNVQRMGALEALKNPNQAICMEFTDLFIAISRAAGIPAREINGYAYTENPELQPLSLVADVLHSWPEYYDKDKGAWIPIDPTWASTSGGVDYFDKLDLRHFAFVIHGDSSTKPYAPGSYKLGPNPQKDIFVSFGKLPQDRISVPVLNATPKRTIPFLNYLYSVRINNPGPIALYSIYPSIYFDSNLKNRDFIEVLPPYSYYDLSIKVPFSLLGKDTPDVVRVEVGESQIQISTNKTQVVVNSLLVLCLILIIFIVFTLIRLKKINFAKIASVYEKFARKFRKNKDK